MYLRLLQLKIDERNIEKWENFYDQIATAELQKIPGCRFANLIQSSGEPNEFISMTLWDNQEHAEAYEKSEVFRNLLQQTNPYLAESTEWKVELNKEMELKYAPAPQEPVLKEYTVSIHNKIEQIDPKEIQRMYVRFVSVKIKKDKLSELRTIYDQEIIPALKATKGCRYAFLIEGAPDKDEAVSLTIWDSPEDAAEYEKSGRFNQLVDKIKHTFSDLYQWKMTLEKDFSGQIKTSEDLSISRYMLVSGKKFN